MSEISNSYRWFWMNLRRWCGRYWHRSSSILHSMSITDVICLAGYVEGEILLTSWCGDPQIHLQSLVLYHGPSEKALSISWFIFAWTDDNILCLVMPSSILRWTWTRVSIRFKSRKKISPNHILLSLGEVAVQSYAYRIRNAPVIFSMSHKHDLGRHCIFCKCLQSWTI